MCSKKTYSNSNNHYMNSSNTQFKTKAELKSITGNKCSG